MTNKNKWQALPLKDRAFLIKLGVQNGITDLGEIKTIYEDTDILGTPYRTFESGSDYDYYNAAPENMPKSKEDHWTSRNPRTGQLLKSSNHPTYNKMIEEEKAVGYNIKKIGDREYSFPNNHYFDGKHNHEISSDSNKVSEHYLSHFPYLAYTLDMPLYTDEDRAFREAYQSESEGYQSVAYAAEKVTDRIKNFSKNDSLVYHPLLDRTNDFLQNRYDKMYEGEEPSNEERKNMQYTIEALYDLSKKTSRPYNDNHKYINETLVSLTDDEISKLLGTKFFGKGASIIKGLQAKPKNLKLADLIKMYRIMQSEYFQEESDPNIEAFLGGKQKHEFSGEEDTGILDSILNIFKREETPKDTRKTAGPVDLDEIRIRQAWAESRYDDNAKSRAGARGRFQIMPAVQADYIKAGGKNGNLHNAKYNTQVRDWYMDNLSGRTWVTKGNATDSVKMGKQLAAYNAGPTKVLNALQKAKNDGVDIYDSFDWVSTKYLKPETVDYVNWILRNKTTGSHRNDTVYQENKHKYKK